MRSCIDKVCGKITTDLGCSVTDIKGIGITNQRETTVVWDKTTGKLDEGMLLSRRHQHVLTQAPLSRRALAQGSSVARHAHVSLLPRIYSSDQYACCITLAVPLTMSTSMARHARECIPDRLCPFNRR